ncbi:unnamed protein product, partial [Heterosigma akashiwo]
MGYDQQGGGGGGPQETDVMGVPDDKIGAVIGRAGATIGEIHRRSGATLHVSAKNEFAPGTKDRIVTLRGPREAIQAARALITQKLHEAESRP